MSERNGYRPGVPCWVDIWQPDAEAAARFYTRLFGWEAEETTPPGASTRYFMFRLGGRDVAAAGSPLAGDGRPAWSTYVWVENADEAAERVTAAGGRLQREPFDSLDGGRMTIAEDPAGAVIGLWQLGSHRGAQLVNEPGAWSMSLLTTPDPERAAAFYRAVLGWETDSFGDITLFRLPGYVGGRPLQPVPRDVVAAMQAGEPAAWSIDFWVHDTDAAARQAAELGGRVLVPPFDAAVGRSAVVADPNGAAFSVSRVVPPA